MVRTQIQLTEEQVKALKIIALSRRKLSLVDCISFEIMRNSGIKTIFTFDSHFAEQGFHCIP